MTGVDSVVLFGDSEVATWKFSVWISTPLFQRTLTSSIQTSIFGGSKAVRFSGGIDGIGTPSSDGWSDGWQDILIAGFPKFEVRGTPEEIEQRVMDGWDFSIKP